VTGTELAVPVLTSSVPLVLISSSITLLYCNLVSFEIESGNTEWVKDILLYKSSLTPGGSQQSLALNFNLFLQPVTIKPSLEKSHFEAVEAAGMARPATATSRIGKLLWFIGKQKN
jgi:hypothetical protein